MRLKFLLGASVFLAAVAAHAATMSYNVRFTATGPNPASGSFTLTFDPTTIYTDQTTGLTVNSFNQNLMVPTSVGFDFNPGTTVFGTGTLTIGGTLNGVGYLYGGTTDYALVVSNFLASPALLYFDSSDPSTAPGYYYEPVGTVSVTVLPSAVTPEPSSIALLGTGLLGVAGVVRRRFA